MKPTKDYFVQCDTSDYPAWSLPEGPNPFLTLPADADTDIVLGSVQGRFPFASIVGIRGIVVDGAGRIFGVRSVTEISQSGYAAVGRVSLYGKRARVHTSDVMFRRPDGGLTKAYVLRLSHGAPIGREREAAVAQAIASDRTLRAYLEAVLFTDDDHSTPDGPVSGIPLQRNYSVCDFDAESVERIQARIATFRARAGELIDQCQFGDEQVGRYLWLSTQGHGVSFRDCIYDNGTHPRDENGSRVYNRELEDKVMGLCFSRDVGSGSDSYVSSKGKIIVS
jgi:hypothetical protein